LKKEHLTIEDADIFQTEEEDLDPFRTEILQQSEWTREEAIELLEKIK